MDAGTTCLSCTSGLFSVGGSAATCKSCPNGWWSSDNAAMCIACVAGRYSLTRETKKSTDCVACLAGRYSVAVGSSDENDCVPCTLGKWNSVEAADHGSMCLECPSGFYGDEIGRVALCTGCDSGLYLASRGSFEPCTKCPKGYVQPMTECASCVACLPGQAAKNEGSLECESCVAGQFASTTRSQFCVECPSGYYSETPKLALCFPCIPGSFSSATGQKNCLQCQAGLYASVTASSKCLTCKNGQWSTASSNIECRDCPAGRYGTTTGCHACPQGQYRSETSDTTKCLQCTRGKYQNKISQSTCKSCVVGKFMHRIGSTTCLDCPRNTFTALSSATWCENCTVGMYTSDSGSSSCIRCRSGKYGVPCSHTSQEYVLLSSCCRECEAGRISDYNSVSMKMKVGALCQDCPVGKHQPSHGQQSCLHCIPGKYADATRAKICINCKVNTYSPSSGRTNSCINCPFGRSSSSGSTQCSGCPSGTAILLVDGISGCIACPAGMFSEETNAASCRNCTIGTYNALPRQSKCTSCPQGKTQPTKGQTSCLNCPLGKYRSSYDSGSDIECVQCSKGTFQPKEGQASCLPCNLGSFQYRTGQSSCLLCEPNTKAEFSGSIICVACNDGEKSDRGSASCVKCQPGSAGTPCTPCVKGFYRSSEHDDASRCFPCQVGKYTDVPSQASCLPCIPGTFQSKEGKDRCLLCAINDYQPSQASKKCLSCVRGRFSDTGSPTCSACSAGRHIKNGTGSECILCPTGYAQDTPNSHFCESCGQFDKGEFAKEGSTQCENCPVGLFQKGVVGICENCPAGKYQDGKGMKSCKVCPPDTYSEVEGATSLSDCTECKNDRTTGKLTGRSVDSDCKCRSKLYYVHPFSKECTPCPAGADCSSKNGLEMEEIFPLPGFWKPRPNTTIFVSCANGLRSSNAIALSQERCCSTENEGCRTSSGGSRDNTNQSALANSNQSKWNRDVQCLDGYIGPICRSCRLEDHVPLGDSCKKCEGGPQPMDTVIAMVIGACIFLLCMVVILSRQSFMERILNTHSQGRLYGQIKIIISFLQICSSYTVAYDTVPWPSFFRDFSLGLGFINLDFLFVLAGSKCNMALPFLDRFLIHMSTPPLLLLSLFIAYLLASKILPKIRKMMNCSKEKDKKTKSLLLRMTQLQYRMSIKIAIFLCLLLYPGLATSLFLMLRCHEIPEVGLVLGQDYSILCFTWTHGAYMSIVAGCMGLYVVGIPVFVFVVLWMNVDYLHDRHSIYYEEVRMKYGGLYVQYEKPYWWFEMTTLFYKMVITGALSIASPGTPFQLVLANLVMLLYMLLVLRTMPYVHDVDDWMSFMTSLSLVLTTFSGFVLVMDAGWKIKTFDSESVGIGLVALNLTTLLMQILHVIFLRWKLWDTLLKKCHCNNKENTNDEDEDSDNNDNGNENGNDIDNGNENGNGNGNGNGYDNGALHSNVHIVPIEKNHDDSNSDSGSIKGGDDDDTGFTPEESKRIHDNRNRNLTHTRSSLNKAHEVHHEFFINESALQEKINKGKKRQKRQTQLRLQLRTKLKKMKVIHTIPAFSLMTEKQIECMIEMMEVEKHENGAVLCKQGEPALTFYIVMSGQCAAYINLKSTGIRKVGTIPTNGFFGEHSLLYHTKDMNDTNPTENVGEEVRSATVKVTSENGCHLLVLHRSVFFEMMKKNVDLDVKTILDEVKRVDVERTKANHRSLELLKIPAPPEGLPPRRGNVV